MSTPVELSLKFRQAAFGYLFVGILYESAVWVLWRRGLAPTARGAPQLWLLAGALVVALVFWLLYKVQNRWIARIIFAVHAVRVPFIMEGAFFPAPQALVPATLYVFALVVVLLNLGLLARAGWDL